MKPKKERKKYQKYINCSELTNCRHVEPFIITAAWYFIKNKPSTPGCIKDRSLYFIPAGKTFFKKDTWAQLYEIYAIYPYDIDNKKEITVEGSLDVKMIDDIVNCLFLAEEENISPIHKKLLRPPLQESLLKLQEKFNKHK